MCNSEDVTDLDVRRCVGKAAGFWGGGEKERELARWEEWSVKSGLAKSSGAGMEAVVSCPTVDCTGLFVADARKRRSKTDRECKSYYSIFRLTYRPPMKNGNDKRRVWCDLCKAGFCIVCRRKWTQPRKRFREMTEQQRHGVFYGPNVTPPTDTHSGKSCVAFKGGNIKISDNNFVAENVKNCPFCSLAVERTYGCNHISCRCGRHWCFVCEESWNRVHYQCRDETGTTFSRGGGANGDCLVS
ncbi:hypothetical protein TrRE_jg4436 [Triparma retinervis]|uniref:RBR-type E3 ubiquitin transferase n=1 Tax=Triparma retinervis TaxID=2557542 RepID=A0A9W7AZN7_9STRA|nr:hypothetical protein TrRE_jg4436 [Triparma retinervis]